MSSYKGSVCVRGWGRSLVELQKMLKISIRTPYFDIILAFVGKFDLRISNEKFIRTRSLRIIKMKNIELLMLNSLLMVAKQTTMRVVFF